MLALSAPDYDPIGHIVLPIEIRDLYGGDRRTTVTATLDGGSAVYDTGFSISDRPVTATLPRARRLQIGAVAYLVETYPRLIVATRAGVFRALAGYRTNKAELTITLTLLERLS